MLIRPDNPYLMLTKSTQTDSTLKWSLLDPLRLFYDQVINIKAQKYRTSRGSISNHFLVCLNMTLNYVAPFNFLLCKANHIKGPPTF